MVSDEHNVEWLGGLNGLGSLGLLLLVPDVVDLDDVSDGHLSNWDTFLSKELDLLLQGEWVGLVVALGPPLDTVLGDLLGERVEILASLLDLLKEVQVLELRVEDMVDVAAGLSNLTNQTTGLTNALENLSGANVAWSWLLVRVEGAVNTLSSLRDLTDDVANLSHGLESLVGVLAVVEVNELVLHFQN